MRSCSLRGTLPLNTSASVPRLMPRVERAHERLVRGRRGQRLRANLAAARLGDPECARVLGAFRHLKRVPLERSARAAYLQTGRQACKRHALMPIPPVVDAQRRPRSPARRWPRGAAAAVALAVLRRPSARRRCSRADSATARSCSRAAVLAGGRRRAVAVARCSAARRRDVRCRQFGDARARRADRIARRPARRRAAAALGWMLVGLGVVAVALDGVDGVLARSRNEASAFGARFDMETDALLILVLAALVWQHGKAGAWILAAGLRAICSSRRAGPSAGSAPRCRRAGAARPCASCRSCRCSARSRPSSCRRGAPRSRSRGSRRSSGRSASTFVGSRGTRDREAAMMRSTPAFRAAVGRASRRAGRLECRADVSQRLADAMDPPARRALARARRAVARARRMDVVRAAARHQDARSADAARAWHWCSAATPRSRRPLCMAGP